MKIKDFMKSVSKDEVIFIGSMGSFMFIGTSQLFDKHKDALNQLNISRVTEYRRRKQLTVDSINRGEPIQKNLKLLMRDIERYNNYLDNYVPIEERDILESYERIQGDGIVAIVPGEEQGNCWFQHDYICSFIYHTNNDFKKYVTKYCEGKALHPIESYGHAIVQEVAKSYL